MWKYKLVTEEGKQVDKPFDDYGSCEMVWDYYKGIYKDENGEEHCIYIKEFKI